MPSFDADEFTSRLEALATPENLKKYEGFFPPDKRNGDVFIGVRMGHIFALAKEFKAMSLDEIEKLLESPIHEARVGAISVMDFQARDRKTTEARRKELYELYLRRHDRINYWDLVDRGVMSVVGGYLVDKPKDVLYQLAVSEDMWERRSAIVATIPLAASGDPAHTFKIAKILINEKEDLIQKAAGWALRSAGGQELVDFLDKNAAKLPRVTLRYAIEKFDKDTRDSYLKAKSKAT